MSDLNDTEILPVNREKLEPIEEEQSAPAPEPEAEESDKEEGEKEISDEMVFDKEKKRLKEKKEIEIKVEEKPKKKKRVLSEAQKQNLAKAREKSLLRRRELKEAKLIEEEKKKMARELKREEKAKKQEEQQEMIRLKAKLQSEAEKNATWDEARLEGLMERTIENYIKKKKSMKPEPKVHIPHNLAHPNLPAHHPVQQDPKYYQPVPQQSNQYFNHHYTQNKLSYQQQPKKGKNNDPLSSLFGFDPNQQ